MTPINIFFKRKSKVSTPIIVLSAIFSLTVLLTFGIGNNPYLNPNIAAAQLSENMEIINNNISSVPHDVKGHEGHQVVKFLGDGLEANNHVGVVSFNSSKPVDIIAYSEIANNNSTTTAANNNSTTTAANNNSTTTAANNNSTTTAANNNSTTTASTPKKIWYTETNQFEPETLLKNVSNGSVNFDSNGILAHRPSNDTFFVNFTLSNQVQ
ncbi:MAG: hypothetical protein AB7V56_11975 [Candidatus Nitrosocosmicus sp.]